MLSKRNKELEKFLAFMIKKCIISSKHEGRVYMLKDILIELGVPNDENILKIAQLEIRKNLKDDNISTADKNHIWYRENDKTYYVGVIKEEDKVIGLSVNTKSSNGFENFTYTKNIIFGGTNFGFNEFKGLEYAKNMSRILSMMNASTLGKDQEEFENYIKSYRDIFSIYDDFHYGQKAKDFTNKDIKIIVSELIKVENPDVDIYLPTSKGITIDEKNKFRVVEPHSCLIFALDDKAKQYLYDVTKSCPRLSLLPYTDFYNLCYSAVEFRKENSFENGKTINHGRIKYCDIIYSEEENIYDSIITRNLRELLNDYEDKCHFKTKLDFCDDDDGILGVDKPLSSYQKIKTINSQ